MMSSSSTEPLLSISALRHTYSGRQEWILDGLSLVLQPGERIAIMGRSGAGKSTLLNILALLQEVVDGDFHFNGRRMRGAQAREREIVRANWIGMVFQAHYLIPWLTVRENVALALELRAEPIPSNQVDILIDGVGLSHRRHHLPTQLSGGEQQRVGLARALVKQPLLLLADEPTGNLDEETGGQVLDLMLHNEIYQGAVIAVTYQEHVARRFEKRYLLEGGILKAVDPQGNPL